MLAPNTNTQRWRTAGQVAFFALFMFAPIFDILRLDLIKGHFILLGFDWTLGLEGFQNGTASGAEATVNLLLRGFLPLAVIAGAFIISSYYWGRLYCGWLCPHFTVVETINNLLQRAIAKPSLWEKQPLPAEQADGSIQTTHPIFKWITAIAVVGFAFLWAITFLTYLLPPKLIYHNLFTGQLSFNQTAFLTAATILLSIEFAFARHFFCRFACAVGLFQSLSWMSNVKAKQIVFDEKRASLCKDCVQSCDNVCPMRLKTRSSKRKKFTCTTCLACVSACTQVQKDGESLLKWAEPDASKAMRSTPVSIPVKTKKAD